ncbi:MAG: MFS transporter [Rubrivivax sp.]|nr:MFS transporter [Rubrivivax sp.]
MSDAYLHRIYLRLAGAIMAVVILALVATAAFSHRTFEHALAPELARKAATVGATIRSLMLKAHDNQVDLKDLFGIDQVFEEVRKTIPEIASFAITDAQGNLVHSYLKLPSGAQQHFRKPEVLATLDTPDSLDPAVLVAGQYVVSLPVVTSTGDELGLLHLGVDANFVDAIVIDMFYDVLVILIVALFFTLELLHFMAGARLEADLKALGQAFDRGASGHFATPARSHAGYTFGSLLAAIHGVLTRLNNAYQQLVAEVQRQRQLPTHERHPALASVQSGLDTLARRFQFGVETAPPRGDESELARVRAPLFLFILAEELTRPFLPGYVKQLLVPVPGLSEQFVVGLPIALFMLIVGLTQPWLGVLCERRGTRPTMLLGAGIAAAGFLASAMAVSVFDLLLWRSLCALGYAMVFVSGQAYVLEHASPSKRAKSFALFVGAIMVASICGPSIGGILADNVGERTTLVVAALLAAGSMLAIQRLPAPVKLNGSSNNRVPSLREIGLLMSNARFMTVTGLAAVPAKILLTGLCFYLVPLYILAIEGTQAMAGRILMTYAVLMVVVSPFTAAWATSRERMEWLVGCGLLLSGLGGVLLLAGASVAWIFVAVALVGLGQSMSISAQSALVAEHCEDEVRRIGEGTVYGVYRLLERMGNAAGPMLAAALVVAVGYRHAFVAIGAAVAACGLAFLIVTRLRRTPAAVPA